MEIKRFFLAALGVLFASAAAAIGPYDGIYNLPNTPEYLSVHQNGSGMIIGAFSTIPASNITFLLGDGQSFAPSRVDYWDLFSGTINGNFVSVSGEVAYGACLSEWDVRFFASAVTVTQTFISTTQLGFDRGINCPGYQNYLVSQRGLTQTYSKVY